MKPEAKVSSCLESRYKRNFFRKQEKPDNAYVFTISNGLTYEEIVTQELPKTKTNKKGCRKLTKEQELELEINEDKVDVDDFSETIIHFPLNADVELQPISKDILKNRLLEAHEKPSKLLTAQIRLLSMPTPSDTWVYSLEEKTDTRQINPRLDFIPLQVLVEEFNFKVQTFFGRKWFEIKQKKYPKINIVIYCFSGKETIFHLFNRYTLFEAQKKCRPGGPGLQELLKKVKNGFLNESKSYLHAGNKPWINQSIELPYLLTGSTINSDNQNIRHKFKVSLQIIDIYAIHSGKKELSEIASTVNVPYKPKIKDEEKDNLQVIYEKDFQKFLEDTKAKCIFHDILMNYHEKMQEIYQELHIPNHRFSPPRLSIGATVKNLLEAAVINYVQEANPEIKDKTIKSLLKLSSIKSFQEKLNNQLANDFKEPDKNISEKKSNSPKDIFLLTKVIGARSHCGKPLHLAKKNEIEVICDSDIEQAYPSVLKYSVLPLGHFQIVKDITLKEYIKNHRNKAEKNLEIVYITVKNKDLPESQNFIPSVQFCAPNNLSQDNANDDVETRIYTHEIFQSPFTSSTFDWLKYVATKDLQEYIENNAQVVIGAYYNKEKFIPLEDLGKHLEHFDKEELWTKVELGPLLVNKLIDKRKSYLKKSKGGTDETEAMNTLIKLMNNTIYGALSNKNFDISNPIVANNVTSDIRLMAWCMETALGGFQTITDGVSWCLNSVLVGRDKRYKPQHLNSLHHLVHRLSGQKSNERIAQGWTWAAIGTARCYKWRDADVLEYRKGETEPIVHRQEYNDEGKPQRHPLLQHLDEYLIPQHLQDCFKELKDFLKNFTIDSKGLYTSITTDGMTNYILTPPKSYLGSENEPIIKRRSHNTKREEGKNIFIQYYLEDLRQNPECVPIPMPYIDYEVVSCGEYQKRYESHYQYSMLIPGDYEPKVKTFQAFQISQFTFRTRAQYKAFRTEHENARKKYGLSAERYHKPTRDNRVLENYVNYEEMIKEYDDALCHQKKSSREFYSTYRNYQNGKNRTRLRKYNTLLPEKNPKEEKENLNKELRKLFDYEYSGVEEVGE